MANDLERFHRSYYVHVESGCWIWQLSADKRGYGYFSIKHKTIKAHRAGWQLLRGQCPPSLEPDHLCRVPCCVNPDHLEWVTKDENRRRAVETNSPQFCPNRCPVQVRSTNTYGHTIWKCCINAQNRATSASKWQRTLTGESPEQREVRLARQRVKQQAYQARKKNNE